MKKIISILLIFTLLAVPTAFADETASNNLQSVLVKVKTKISVPDELSEFNGNVSNYSGKTYYNFDWHTPDYEKSVSVASDENGNITNYSNHSEKISSKKLSGISKSEIIAYADAFIEKVFPEVYKTLVLDVDSYRAGGSSRYSFTYQRYINGIAVKDNFIDITVCISENDTLFVRNVSANIDYTTPFEESAGELEGYVQKYKEAFPLELVYYDEYNYDRQENGKSVRTPVLIYRHKDNISGFISEKTGEIVTEDKADEIFKEESSNDAAMGGGSSGKDEILTEQELNEISAVEGLLSLSQIESKVKSVPYIKFPAGVKRESSFLYKNEDGNYLYNTHYSSDEKGNYSYVSFVADAKDGKLLSYSRSSDNNRDTTLSESQKNSAEDKIEKFLTAVAKEEFSSTKPDETKANGYLLSKYYQREVNGIKHLNNGINVTFDVKNSFVTNFYFNFTDGDFENPEKAVEKDIAYENILKYSPIVKLYVKTGGAYKVCYTLKQSGVTVDALTGNIRNEFNEKVEQFSYTDISGHWAEEAATKLSEIQVGLLGGKLNPSEAITQEDYLRLLAAGVYGTYYNGYTSEELYDTLIRNEIIKSEEKNPASPITREESFVYMIRVAGLEKVAALENIFKVDYSDRGSISKGKTGYVAILSGFGVIGGGYGYLRPQDNLTRAEAIVVVYRYLLNM